MIDAGYSYDRLAEKMKWLGIEPSSVEHILITHWFGVDGGYSFINSLAEDNDLAKRSLAALERKLRDRGLSPKVITGHTGWSDNLDFVFAHKDQVCNSMRKQKPHDPSAPYDGYDEREDTEERARKTVPARK